MDELRKNLVPQSVISKSSKSPNSFAWHKTLGPGVCLYYFQSPPTVLTPLSPSQSLQPHWASALWNIPGSVFQLPSGLGIACKEVNL